VWPEVLKGGRQRIYDRLVCCKGCSSLIAARRFCIARTNHGAYLMKGTARIQISPEGEGSELQCESEGQVGGLIAQVGSRLVEAVGKKRQDEFFGKLG
jgi:carbon monoxide dehydrogenase subunit G